MHFKIKFNNFVIKIPIKNRIVQVLIIVLLISIIVARRFVGKNNDQLDASQEQALKECLIAYPKQSEIYCTQESIELRNKIREEAKVQNPSLAPLSEVEENQKAKAIGKLVQKYIKKDKQLESGNKFSYSNYNLFVEVKTPYESDQEKQIKHVEKFIDAFTQDLLNNGYKNYLNSITFESVYTRYEMDQSNIKEKAGKYYYDYEDWKDYRN